MKEQVQIREWDELLELERRPQQWSWGQVDAIYQYQYRYNPVFRKWVDGLGRYREKVTTLDDLTFLPIQFFKTGKVYCAPTPPEVQFQSSGTTGQVRSRHGLSSVALYHLRCEVCFSEVYGPVSQYRHLFFLPFYTENPHSSLISMARHFVDLSRRNGSRFITDVREIEKSLGESPCDTVLWTVTFGAMDILDLKIGLNHPNLIFLETGGSKGQREVLPRDELHTRIKGLGVDITVGSEYGMCELSSQCYYKDGRFRSPAGFSVVTSEIDDPLSWTKNEGARGRVCIIDTANLHSCAFIETEDVGRSWQDGSFLVEGRLDTAELRGCNLMYAKEDLLDQSLR